jgi:hypothetical protein
MWMKFNEYDAKRRKIAGSPQDKNKAKESERGMPGLQEPKKDVVHCEKCRVAVCRR